MVGLVQQVGTLSQIVFQEEILARAGAQILTQEEI
jgi:hypothetical protein